MSTKSFSVINAEKIHITGFICAVQQIHLDVFVHSCRLGCIAKAIRLLEPFPRPHNSSLHHSARQPGKQKNLPLQESHPVRRGFEIACHDEPTHSAGWSGRSGTLSFYFSSGYNWVQNSPPATRAVSASAAAWAAKMPVYPARARPATRASAKITPCRLMDSTKAAPALPVD